MASAIRITDPAHAHEVDPLVSSDYAEIVTVADSQITAAWLDLAGREGIFCEPASAASLAALAQIEVEPGSTVVCVLTGHGLKDIAAVELHTAGTTMVDPSLEAILAEVSP
jgi:threonine synthase